MSGSTHGAGHRLSPSRSPDPSIDFSHVQNIIKVIIDRSRKYEEIMSRVQDLLEVIWDDLNADTRIAIRNLLLETLKAIDDHIAEGGLLRVMVRKLPTPSTVLEVIEEHVGVGKWDSKISRDALDQVLDAFVRASWAKFEKIRKQVKDEPRLYAEWGRVEAPRQFQVIKRLWDLHERIVNTIRKVPGLDITLISPSKLLNETGYFPRSSFDHTSYRQVVDAADRPESGQSPFVSIAQEPSSLSEPTRPTVQPPRLPTPAHALSKDKVVEILNEIEERGPEKAKSVRAAVGPLREMLCLIWPSLATPSRTKIHGILRNIEGSVVNSSLTVNQIVAKVPSPSNLLKAIAPLYEVQSVGSKLPNLPRDMLDQALASVTLRANPSVKNHTKLKTMAIAFRAERDMYEDWSNLIGAIQFYIVLEVWELDQRVKERLALYRQRDEVKLPNVDPLNPTNLLRRLVIEHETRLSQRPASPDARDLRNQQSEEDGSRSVFPPEPFSDRARSREDRGSPVRSSSSQRHEHHATGSPDPVSRSPSHHETPYDCRQEEDDAVPPRFVAQAGRVSPPQVLARHQGPFAPLQHVLTKPASQSDPTKLSDPRYKFQLVHTPEDAEFPTWPPRNLHGPAHDR